MASERTVETVYAVSVMFEVAVYRVDEAALLSAQTTQHIVALDTYLLLSQFFC